jgi:hypothetical protein
VIKVYVFVTGLVLYQFSTTPGEPARAILAAGGFQDVPLAGLLVPPHELEVRTGLPSATLSTTTPFHWSFSTKCNGCPPIEAPTALLDVRRAFPGAAVQQACRAIGNAAQIKTALEQSCRPNGLTSRGAKGVLEFSGRWKAVPMTDCGAGYPERFDRQDYFTFVNANQASKLIIQNNPPLPAPIANSVLFTAEVPYDPDLSELGISDDTLRTRLKAAVRDAADCALLPGFATSYATKCVAMVVRVGPAAKDEVMGGALTHFAALYGLLDDFPPAADTWLPIVTQSRSCGHGGGSGGGSHCVGGKVVD